MSGKKAAYEVELQGCVFSAETQLDADEFLDKFIDFIEENHWYFGGGVRQIIDGYYVDNDLKPIEPVGD